MFLNHYHAEALRELGFPQKSPAPGDSYEVGNEGEIEEWILGGQIAPKQTLLAPQYVVKSGIWIPCALDLLQWLEQQSPGIKVSYDRTNYFVPRGYVDVVVKGTPIQAWGGGVASGLSICAEKVLLFNQNKPWSDKDLKRLRKEREKREQRNREN